MGDVPLGDVPLGEVRQAFVDAGGIAAKPFETYAEEAARGAWPR